MSPKCEIEPRVFKQRTLAALVFVTERAARAQRQVTRGAAGGDTQVSANNQNITRMSRRCHEVPVAGHAAEDLVDVVGPHLQWVLSEDDLPGCDVTCGHHVATETENRHL